MRDSAASRTFSSEGRLLTVRNAAGALVSLEYSSAGRLAAARYRGRRIEFTFDGARIAAIADSAGRSVTYSYDGAGRLAGHVNADGVSVAYEYDGSGNLTSINHAGRVTNIAYEGEPGYTYVASVTAPDGHVTAV